MFIFESPSVVSVSQLGKEVGWDLRAMRPGQVILRVSVNYETAVRFSDGSQIFHFTTGSSGSVPVEVVGAAEATPVPLPTPTVFPASDVRIECILFDGQVPRSEADEYVQITNIGGAPQELLGWVLRDRKQDFQSFTFPDYSLGPGATIRVYTNEVHEEWEGFSFGSGSAIWNNTVADTAWLLDDKELLVSEESYDAGTPPGCQEP